MTLPAHIKHILPAALQEWKTSPWPLAHELSNILPFGSWTLVGGLMVRLRAILHGVPPSRATTDVDATVSIARESSVTYNQLAQTLAQAGFEHSQGTKYAYRFTRANSEHCDIVDLMFPDGVPSKAVPRFGGRPVLSIPGGMRAISQHELVILQGGEQEISPIFIPSLRDSLVVKGAAYMVDSRDRKRHLDDAITLLACVEQPAEIHRGLSTASKKRIRALLQGLEDREVWIHADPVARDLAELVINEMRARFDVSGTMTPEQVAKLYDH